MGGVDVTNQRIRISELECRDEDVVGFFEEISPESRPELVCKALSLGVVGLRAMGVAGHVEIVEREFLKLSHGFESALNQTERDLMERVDLTFDPDRAESVSARLGATIAEAYKSASGLLDQTRSELEDLVSDAFNPDLASSCIYRITKLVTDTKAEIERAFDPAYEDSHIARLVGIIDDYFGETGLVSEVVATQVTPIKDEVLAALQDLRDLVVGQAAASQARRLSPASGSDFEDEVESILRKLAKAYGDSVERVGSQAGDAGLSKRGDFVIELREGPRFTVEAKDYSSPITLRGSRGILAALDDSMVNRASTFAVAVMREEGGFPKEVGSFNDYDSNKVLCYFGPEGELLEVGYRWARTVLLATASRKGVDVAIVEAGLEEARLALREIARIEGKAKAIVKNADEIQGIVTFQLRRAINGLDEAASGLTVEIAEAS